MSPRLEYLLRFSVGHEIGHLVLQCEIYGGLQINGRLDSLCPTFYRKLFANQDE
jgi:hypothetical protein